MALDYKLTLQMLDKVSGPVKQMQEHMKRTSGVFGHLQNQAKDTTGYKQNITSMQVMTKKIGESKTKLKTYETTLQELESTIQKNGKATKAQLAKQNKLKDSIKNSKSEVELYQDKLKTTGAALKKAGVNTKNLVAAGKKLDTQLQATSQRMKTATAITKQFAAAKKNAAKFAKISAVGFGVASAGAYRFGGMLKKTADELDKLTKTSQNLKIPLDYLQALKHQGSLTGVSTEGISKSFQVFNKNLGELKTKKSSMLSTALKDFDPALLDKLKNSKGSADAYNEVLSAIDKIPDATKQAAIANAMFGREGKNMLIMLRQGQDGFIKSQQEMQSLGGGANTEQAKIAEQFNDTLLRLKTTMNSIKFQVLAPALKEVTTMMSGLIEKFKNAEFRKDLMAKINGGVKTAVSLFKGVWEVMKALSPVVLAIANNFKLFAGVIIGLKFASVLGGINGMITGFTALKALLLTNPITAILTGIATAGYVIYDNWSGIADFFKNMWSNIKSYFYSGVASTLESMKSMLDNVPDFLLPESMEGDNINETIASYRKLAKEIKNHESIKKTKEQQKDIKMNMGIDTTQTQKIAKDINIKERTQKVVRNVVENISISKVQVDLKIESEKQITAKNITKTAGVEVNVADVGRVDPAGY
jgi:hypothetical protein